MPITYDNPMKDAPASHMDNEYSFFPPDGPFDGKSPSSMFKGTLNGRGDEDWIRIDLKAGSTYVISVTGEDNAMTPNGAATDTVLKMYDSKGGAIDDWMNDDINPVGSMDNPANLNSRIRIMAEEDGTYYISVSSYTGNPTQDNSGDYTITVQELDLPADIMGTEANEKLVGTDGAESIAGEGGNDSLYGMGGDDKLDGGAGDDLLSGGPGADELKGGANAPGDMAMGDTISYKDSMEGVDINLRAGSADGGDAEGDTIGEDIENVEGSMYDDEINGSRGANKLWGLGGDDEISGDRGHDMLYGGAGMDMLDGGDGDDVLEGGYGADELTGGDGDDTASYAGSMMGVTVRLHASQAMGGDAEGDTWGDVTTVEYDNPDPEAPREEATLEETVPDIVNLTGSNMADNLAGDSRVNVIKGMGGDDKIYGGPGGGNDMLHGGMGMDMLFGGIGDDDLFGDGGDDTLNGGAGNDEFYGGAGSDLIYADRDDTTINGWVMTPPENDDATPDVDESTEAGSDPMTADTVSYEKVTKGTAGITATLEAGGITNIENMIGSPLNDTLNGDGEDNVIEGGDGADALDGLGNPATDAKGDTVSYRSSDKGVSVTVSSTGAGSAFGGHAQGDTVTNFENAIGSAHDDDLVGDATANSLSGLAGDDELIGNAGSDTIEGGAGADEMDGGTSDASTTATDDNGADTEPDTLSYASSDAGVSVNFTTLTFSGGHAEGDEVEVQRDAYDPDGPRTSDGGELDPVDVSTFENITGSMHNDRLTGDHRMNVLMGMGGDDTLRGMAGADTLNGGPGADVLDGGEDAREKDDMVPDPSDGTGMIAASMDVATYAGAMAGITLNLHTGRGTAGDAMGDRLIGIEKVVGSSNDDTFIAGSGVDNIDGGDHDDDDPPGGDMEDGDTVSYELSPEAVTVDLTATDGVQTVASQGDEDSFAGGDTLVGIENVTGSDEDDMITGDTNPNRLMGGDGDDTLTGGDETAGGDTLMGGEGRDTLSGGGGADKLMGGAGNDTLAGGADDDTLNGGAGDDEMTGDGGSDTFVFSPDDGDGDDIITGFAVADDRIDLRAFNLDAEDLIPLISVRGGTVRIDLRSVGGGTIEVGGVTDVDNLEVSGGTTEDKIDTLSVWTDTDNDGVVETGEAGIFIL